MSDVIAQRLNLLRHWLKENHLDALIIPHEDEYLSEYLPQQNERLQWATGFSGSAGVAVITQTKAAIFVDGRYTIQVTKQTPAEHFDYLHLIEQPYLTWLTQTLPANARIGYDPQMHRASWLTESQITLGSALQLIALEQNPIDLFWENRPAPLASQMQLMDIQTAGVSSLEKRQAIAQQLQVKGADSLIITELDAICWLLNVRGLDIPRTPVLLSHAILHANADLDFFFDSQRLANDFYQHVGEGVRVFEPQALPAQLANLAQKTVWFDKNASNAWFHLHLQQAGAQFIYAANPCRLAKATKNAAEVAGMKACHLRDGVAMVRFLHWLSQQVAHQNVQDEASLADQLLHFRQLDPTLVDLSFDTISAAGTNAAMCHYHHQDQPSPTPLTYNTFYLVDSGGQYLDGTTDITRTIAIGELSDEMKNTYTLVLKGHIALATARFPKGTCGYQLDALARQFLWSQGYDYDHGTGHGVGHFLGVHEGPQNISKAPNTTVLLPGMVVSNEPGYYRTNGFGIRIENLELITEIATQGDRPVLTFESLTRCPIDTSAIDLSLMTSTEIQWLNAYHAKVWQELSPLLTPEDNEVRAWLLQATQPLAMAECAL